MYDLLIHTVTLRQPFWTFPGQDVATGQFPYLLFMTTCTRMSALQHHIVPHSQVYGYSQALCCKLWVCLM